MKKVLFSAVAILALTLTSCGGPSNCECKKNVNDKGEAKDKDLQEKCTKMMEGKSDEEVKKMEEEKCD